MKYSLILGFLFVFMLACEKDEHTSFEYHAHIHSPIAGTELIQDDSLLIHVEFESHTNSTIHHINVKIVNADTNQEVYNKPTHAHVHEVSGKYSFEDVILLNEASGFTKGSRWTLKAKVWGEKDGEQEEESKLEFKIKS